MASITRSGIGRGREGSLGRKGSGGGGGRRISLALATACLVDFLRIRSAALDACQTSVRTEKKKSFFPETVRFLHHDQSTAKKQIWERTGRVDGADVRRMKQKIIPAADGSTML